MVCLHLHVFQLESALAECAAEPACHPVALEFWEHAKQSTDPYQTRPYELRIYFTFSVVWDESQFPFARAASGSSAAELHQRLL